VNRVFIALLLIATLTGTGCARSEPEPADPAAPTASAEETTSPVAEGVGLASLEPETDPERAALKAAVTPEGRKWAVGNPDGSLGEAAGDPFLVGYTVLLNDGETQYAVLVLGGEPVPYFAGVPEPFIKSPYAPDINRSMAPATPRQTEAFEAAKASLASVNPKADRGGIEFYRVAFPGAPLEAGGMDYPMVSIYAAPSDGLMFGMGGNEAR
jgi:hypothetical protein